MMKTIKCIAPQELEEGDQIAYIDGEASPLVISHINQCPFCQQEVAILAHEVLLLTDAMFRPQCPDMDMLLLYSHSMISQGELQSIRRHVHTCLDCQTEMAALVQPFFEDKIADFLTTVRRKFHVALKPAPSPRAAQLVFRGDSEQESYSADKYQILLNKLPPIGTADFWQIEGQITCPEDPFIEWVGHVLLTLAGEEVAQAVLDEFGSFAFQNLQLSSYALYFVLPENTVMIDQIMVS